jgi:hypothetical protein
MVYYSAFEGVFVLAMIRHKKIKVKGEGCYSTDQDNSFTEVYVLA